MIEETVDGVAYLLPDFDHDEWKFRWEVTTQEGKG